MRAMSPAELKKELDALASLAVDRLVAASGDDRLRMLFRYSAKSQLCILLAALKHLEESRRRSIVLNARIGALEWAHRVELESLRRGLPLPEPKPGPSHAAGRHPDRPVAPAVSEGPSGDQSAVIVP